MTLKIDNTLVTAIPAWMLPADLHDLAQKWDDLNDKALNAEAAVHSAQYALETAQRLDGEALKTAILDGAGDPGTPNMDKANADLNSAHRVFEATNEALGEIALELRKKIIRSRHAIAAIAREKITPAANKYLQVLTKAEESAAKAATELEDAYGVFTLLEAIDSGYTDEIGVSPATVPSLSTADARNITQRILCNLEVVAAPINPQFVWMKNERVHGDTLQQIRVDRVEYMLARDGWTTAAAE